MSFQAPKKMQLSKNILEMKFMRRTKEKALAEQAAEEGRAMFNKEITEGMKSGVEKFIIEPSYVSCEDLVIGRFSFGGMNPHIEKIMRTEEEASKPKLPESDGTKKDISDLDMAKFSTLMKTMANKFKSKNKRNLKTTNQRKFLKPKDDDE